MSTILLLIHFRGLLPLTEFCPVQNSLYVQVLRSRILAALLHGTPAAGVRQTLRRRTRNGITEFLQRAPPIFGRAAITRGIGPHSSLSCSYFYAHATNCILHLALYCYSYWMLYLHLQKTMSSLLALRVHITTLMRRQSAVGWHVASRKTITANTIDEHTAISDTNFSRLLV